MTNQTSIPVCEVSSRLASVAIRQATKDKLNKYRLPGQSYDGFIQMLIELWNTAR